MSKAQQLLSVLEQSEQDIDKELAQLKVDIPKLAAKLATKQKQYKALTGQNLLI